jgi:hypothetical protein
MKENAPSSNIMYRQDNDPPQTQEYDNSNDAVTEDSFARIRLGFDSPNDFHRQVLIGFMDEHATNAMDVGYDALNIDTQPYDMYLMKGTNKLIIEGESFFNPNSIYPITVKAAADSMVRFVLDDTENLDENQAVYIHDNVTQTYHNIRNGAFEVNVFAGMTGNRFTLRFIDPTLANAAFSASAGIGLTFTNANNTIVLENNNTDTTAQTMVLYNMLGQTVASWNIASENQTKLQIPIVNAHAGTYVIKVHTTSGDISKKIVVQ